MEIKINPPGSKHEAILETLTFELWADDHGQPGKRLIRWGKTEYIDLSGGEWLKVLKLNNTEEMLKGQAFGL